MSRTIIHIGANKTGSTTLQRNLFAKNKELAYLGEDCDGYEEFKDALNSMISDDDIHYDHEATAKIFRQFMSAGGEKTAIYSSEDVMSSRVPAQCARRLHKFMPDAKILLVIRNQLTSIPSWYANHGAYLKMVPRRYWRRYVSFDDWMGYCTEFLKYSPLDSYFYHRILSLYASIFGKERMHVLFYEDFVNKKEHFVKELCKILGIESEQACALLDAKYERKRNTMRMYRYHRFRSKFFWGWSLSRLLPGDSLRRMWHKFLEAGSPADGFMTDYWRNRIIELYREDNSKLAKEYNLPLKEYGYPVT